jgi:hypothetical protein
MIDRGHISLDAASSLAALPPVTKARSQISMTVKPRPLLDSALLSRSRKNRPILLSVRLPTKNLRLCPYTWFERVDTEGVFFVSHSAREKQAQDVI